MPVLELAKHDLDAVAASLPTLVVFERQEARFSPRTAGLDPLRLKGIPEPVGVVAAVGHQPMRLGKVVEKAAAPV